MNQYIKKWNQLISEVKENRKSITSNQLYDKIRDWSFLLDQSKDKYIKGLHDSYLTYYFKLDINQYQFDTVWYSLEDLIEYKLVRPQFHNIKLVIANARDLLHEMIVYKTGRDCKLLEYDNLRAYTNRDYGEIFFCCDSCVYAEDWDGERIEIKSPLLPATAMQVKEKQIAVFID